MINSIYKAVAFFLLGWLHARLIEASGLWVYLVFPVQCALIACSARLALKTAFFYGMLFGLAFFGCASGWMLETAPHFGVSAWVAATVVVMIILLLSLTSGLTLWCMAWGYHYKSRPWLFATVMASAWFLGEWLRTWVLTGLPYYQLGYTCINTPLSGYIPFVGSVGVGFILTLVCARAGLGLTNARSVGVWLASIFIKRRQYSN